MALEVSLCPVLSCPVEWPVSRESRCIEDPVCVAPVSRVAVMMKWCCCWQQLAGLRRTCLYQGKKEGRGEGGKGEKKGVGAKDR